jgi:hypothetical protein
MFYLEEITVYLCVISTSLETVYDLYQPKEPLTVVIKHLPNIRGTRKSARRPTVLFRIYLCFVSPFVHIVGFVVKIDRYGALPIFSTLLKW